MAEINYTNISLLVDSGLLFKINLETLHPLGLALQIAPETGECKLWDYRDDPEGLIYNDEVYLHGMSKLSVFIEEFVNKKLEERQKVLGYVIQPCPANTENTEKE